MLYENATVLHENGKMQHCCMEMQLCCIEMQLCCIEMQLCRIEMPLCCIEIRPCCIEMRLCWIKMQLWTHVWYVNKRVQLYENDVCTTGLYTYLTNKNYYALINIENLSVVLGHNQLPLAIANEQCFVKTIQSTKHTVPPPCTGSQKAERPKINYANSCFMYL